MTEDAARNLKVGQTVYFWSYPTRGGYSISTAVFEGTEEVATGPKKRGRWPKATVWNFNKWKTMSLSSVKDSLFTSVEDLRQNRIDALEKAIAEFNKYGGA